jgi:Uma2 family endonuclease
MPRARASGTNRWLTFADLLHDLGDVAPERVRMRPLPGQATEADLIRIQAHEKRHYELVDGVLVEKIMGAPQSCITSVLDRRVGTFVEDRDLGFVMLPDGPTRLLKGLVRMPDLSFVSWERMPSREYPATAIAGVVPNLAVEVLSEGNTPAEIQRKLKEYFLAGVELAWVVDPFKRTVAVHTAPDRVRRLAEEGMLDGGSVLPGFTLPVKDLFARLPKDFGRRRRRGKESA